MVEAKEDVNKMKAELAIKNQELAAATKEAEALLKSISESTAVAEKGALWNDIQGLLNAFRQLCWGSTQKPLVMSVASPAVSIREAWSAQNHRAVQNV
jgi:hypothetical protein